MQLICVKQIFKQLLQNWIDQQQPEPGVENDLSETGQRKQLKAAVNGKMRSLKCNMTLKYTYTYTAK